MTDFQIFWTKLQRKHLSLCFLYNSEKPLACEVKTLTLYSYKYSSDAYNQSKIINNYRQLIASSTNYSKDCNISLVHSYTKVRQSSSHSIVFYQSKVNVFFSGLSMLISSI
jgi:hypothetical protein